MRTTFFAPRPDGRHQWWTYVLTILLVVTGIIGFGGLPLQIALLREGLSAAEINNLTVGQLNELFSLNESFTFNLFPFVVGFLLLLFAFRYIHRRPPLSFMTVRKSFDLKRFGAGFAVWSVLSLSVFALALWQSPGVLVWNYDPAKFAWLVAICIFLVPLQTGFEELLFRGYLTQLLGRATSKGLVIAIVNGLLFGSLHSMNPEVQELGWFAMVFYVCSGIFAALLTIMDDGIELAWGFHTANNFMGILLVTNQWQVFQTDALFVDVSKPEVGIDLYLTLGLFYPLMLFVFARLYKWSNWKQRLLG